jgi:5,10-methylenetetrahydromethanopterin reductase
MPEQVEHAAVVAKVPPGHTHLELHRGHLIEPNEIDAPFLTPDVIARSTLSAPAEGVRAFLSRLAENGAAAVLYQPAGSDIRRELRAFAQAAGIEALA